ncbi:MAG: threonylcarbamoyl-AMP synthase [Beijerinckiaceae bacterium]|jgi:L-threonylcarbamoyladenylate synthase|nr:threonylcarbamoyl-AMP synthase [Beijerinckiaceae bacterium]
MNLGPADASPAVETRLVVADAKSIGDAANILRAGGLVAFPTETVYGLGADATSGRAVAKIYAAKARPQFNPLISHVPDLASAKREGDFDAKAHALAEAFWPGPLTLVVPVASGCSVSDLARAGLASVALRVPSHPVALELLRAFGKPVAAPSANRSGRVSPTHAAHVMGDLDGRVDMILDGGPTEVGLESTIVACLPDGVRLLRPGGISRARIEELLGEPLLSITREGVVTAPGMLASHYAPNAAMRLEATAIRPGEAVLDFGGRFADVQAASFDLSPRGDLAEAAANLFAFLRALDATGAEVIAVAPLPHEGLGEAINDRLTRAAAPR